MKKNYSVSLKKRYYLFVIVLSFIFTERINAQCAGLDNTVTICNKQDDPSLQSYNLFDQLGGMPETGGTWTSNNPLNNNSLDNNNGTVDLWAITTSGIHSFTYTNNSCNSSAVVTIELGAYAGEDNIDFSANTCADNIEGNEDNRGDQTNLFTFLNNDIQELKVDTNGTWQAIGSNAINANQNLSGSIFDAHGAGVGQYIFTYTVDAVSTCNAQTATLYLQVNRPPEPGVGSNLILCETDDLSLYQNVNLHDYLQSEDNNGYWLEFGTNQLNDGSNTVIDTFVNVEEIYTNNGPGTYSFTYNVQSDFGTCNNDFSTVNISILGYNNQFSVDDYCNDGTLHVDILYQNSLSLDVSHDMVYEIRNTNTNELVYIETITGITMSTLDDAHIGENHHLQPELPDPFTHFYEFDLNPSPITTPGNYTITATSISNLTDVICDTFEIAETTFNVYDPETSITQTCFSQEDIAEITLSNYTGTDGNLVNGTETLNYTATYNGNANIITESIDFVDGNGIIPIDLSLWDLSLVNTENMNLTFNNSPFNSLSCINYSFPFTIIPDNISLTINADTQCNTSNVESIINVPLLANGEYEISFEVKKLGDVTDEILATQEYTTIGGSGIQNNITTLGEGDYVVTVHSIINNDTNTCRAPEDLEVTLVEEFTIYKTPDAPTLEATQSFCFSDYAPNGPTVGDIEVDETEDTLTLTWFSDATSTTPLNLTDLLIHGEDYFVEAEDPNPENTCDESPRTMVTVNVYKTSLIDISNTTTQFCEVDSPTLAQINVNALNGGEIIWYSTADENNINELPLTTNLTNGTSYYVVERNEDCESERTEITATVIPSPITLSSNTFCASPGDDITNLETIVSTDSDYELVWYDAMGTLITDTTTLLTQNTTYRVTSLHTLSGCESEQNPITVYITSPITSTNTTPFFCFEDDATIEFLDAIAENNGDIVWYDSLNLTTRNELSIDTDLENGTTYYAVEKVGNCESIGTPFTPIIIAAPTPINSGSNPICIVEEVGINATISSIEATGLITTDTNYELSWYNTANTSIPNTTELEQGVVYFVRSTHPASGCVSEAIPITVNITSPAVTTNSTPVFCNDDNPTIADLIIANDDGNLTLTWYNASNIIIPITTPLEDEGVYSVTRKIGDCESTPLEFTVSIVSPETPVGSSLICASPGDTFNDIASNFNVTNTELTLVWYNDANVEITDTTTMLTTGNYSVVSTVLGSDCFSEPLEFTVGITSIPVATNTTFSFCGTDNATFATLGASVENGGELIWYDTLTGGTPLSVNITTPLTTGNYFAVEKVGDCESERLPFNVTVVSPETPVYNGDNPVCIPANTSLQDLENNITFNPSFDLIWHDADVNGNVIANSTILTNGNYYVSTTDTASGCESPRVQIIVNIISTVTTTNENQIFCSSDNATLTDIDVVAPNGGQLVWFDANDTVLDNTTPLTNTSYFVIEQNGDCGSITKLQIDITLISPPTPIFEGETELCALAEPTILNLEEQIDFDNTLYELAWYDDIENGNELSTSDLLTEDITYYVVFRDLATNCEGEGIEIDITLSNCDPEEYEFFIPDGFSPNNDLVNDTYYIPNIQYFYPDYDYEIFNRYGQSLFKGNITNPSWDGTNNGSQVETTVGVYFYVINFNKGNLKPAQGRLYLSK